ncbi:hypothetical protein GCM10009846_18180 [Agrococcus versicolor]|uniref:Class I SAM-dependent methyltransferase n=1 Tax=Agrococcus versicolor TaxID=501482 RepID=A0ABN3ASQ6_9MICO
MAPIGRITRGTTGVNRLRRVDRWIADLPAARVPGALVVDLGYGASATTTLELHERLARRSPLVEVVGLEIDPERVALATRELHDALAAGPQRHGRALADEVRVAFALGGFEVPTTRAPHVIRAMNVLRQYDEHEVPAIWQRMLARLAPDGVLVEGTSNEVGRVATWVTLDAAGPRTLTLALRLASLGDDAMPAPSVLAERLPKALIHRNVPGERIHDLLVALDRAWERAAHVGTFGPEQRWGAAVAALADEGWPIDRAAMRRARLGELTVPWASVAPR